MKKPAALIGSETEYGIIVTSESGDLPSMLHPKDLAHTAIRDMLGQGMKIAGGVLKDDSTMSSLEEHEEAERLIKEMKDGTLTNREADNRLQKLFLSQRRGYSGTLLSNGARFYEDMLHPEYSCPECADPYSALVTQKAGDRIVQKAAALSEPLVSRLLRTPITIKIFKNNSDGLGQSYGGHENYLLDSNLFYKLCCSGDDSDATVLFFVARQIITGAGKIGSEYPPHVPYQISQRPDFFTCRKSTSTTDARGIINLRNMPYASSGKSRFHVIVGDSNRSDLSLFLKHGISALFFMMLEDEYLKKVRWPWWGAALVGPVNALRMVSRDLTLSEKLQMYGGPDSTALEIMQSLASCAGDFVAEHSMAPVWRQVVDLWKGVLEGLHQDRWEHPLSRYLDWVIVERMISAKAEKKGISIDSDECREDELDYRRLGDDSIFQKLHDRGRLFQIAKDDDILRAVSVSPTDTRAYLRSEILKRYPEYIWAIRWDHIRFSNNRDVYLPGAQRGGESETRALFEGDPSIEEFIARASAFDEAIIRVDERRSSRYDSDWRDANEGSDPGD